LPADLTGPLGPTQPVLDQLDPLVRRPLQLTRGEFADLTAFVRTGLLDPRATPANLAKLIPPKLPSELEPLEFETDE
jgi:hypothetical protein